MQITDHKNQEQRWILFFSVEQLKYFLTVNVLFNKQNLFKFFLKSTSHWRSKISGTLVSTLYKCLKKKCLKIIIFLFKIQNSQKMIVG